MTDMIDLAAVWTSATDEVSEAFAPRSSAPTSG